MNILFFIGNGFDLNLGMKTRYSDFYKYYQKISSNSNYVDKLKQSISKDLENWSDLELALGKYTLNMDSQEEFDTAFEDIGGKLSDYLEEEESKFNLTQVDKQEFYNYLVFPEKSLPLADQKSINSFSSKWENHQWNVNIITFNYTRTIENLIDDKKGRIKIGIHNNSPTVLQGIQHIHGYTNERRIMGVNDISQISNSSFHKNLDIIEAIVKPECNQAQRHTIDDSCIQLVSQANFICLFGCSIGDTDKLWWELIGKQLQKECILLIYKRCEDIDPRINYKKNRIERDIRKFFLSKTNLKKRKKKRLARKFILVSIQTCSIC